MLLTCNTFIFAIFKWITKQALKFFSVSISKTVNITSYNPQIKLFGVLNILEEFKGVSPNKQTKNKQTTPPHTNVNPAALGKNYSFPGKTEAHTVEFLCNYCS